LTSDYGGSVEWILLLDLESARGFFLDALNYLVYFHTHSNSSDEYLLPHGSVRSFGFAQKPFGWAETEPEAVAPGSVAS
jgi:hypothetical protein